MVSRTLAKLLARLLIRVAMPLLRFAEGRRTTNYITDTARISGWPKQEAREIAALLVERGVTPHQADKEFSRALKWPC